VCVCVFVRVRLPACTVDGLSGAVWTQLAWTKFRKIEKGRKERVEVAATGILIL